MTDLGLEMDGEALRATTTRAPWLASYPDTIAWEMALPPEPVGAMLDRTVERCGDRPCTYFLGKRLTYAAIGRKVERAAAALGALGVQRGVKVGLLLPNCPTFVVYYYAVLKAGGTVVNFNPLYSPEELALQARDSDTTIMVTLDLAILFEKVEGLLASGVVERAVVADFCKLLTPAKSALFRLLKRKHMAAVGRSPMRSKVLLERELPGRDAPFAAPAIDPETDIAVLQYTGGTTGVPKGAMLTHANLTINVRQVDAWRTPVPDCRDSVLGVLPLFHVFAMTAVMNYGVFNGCELILVPKYEIDQTLKLIARTRPTVFPGVPTLFNAMMRHPDIARYDMSSIKFCISGGAALPLEVKQGFEAITRCTVIEGYGLSETSPVATCNPLSGKLHPKSIGVPLPGTRVSIRSLEDPTVEMAIGEAGELCIAGPQVMLGYWNKPEETTASFVGEFFRTGDVGIMDADGYTYIVDRIKDMIIASGFKIYPRRIEDALYQHPAVAEVTVVGIPDDYRGEAPKAFVRLKDEVAATEQELLEFLKSKISKIEMPAAIEFRDALPKTIIGKLSKKELRAEAVDVPAGA